MTVVVGEFLRGALPILYPMVQVRKKLVHDWKSNLVVGFEMLALDGCPHCFAGTCQHICSGATLKLVFIARVSDPEYGATERSWQVHVPHQIAARRGPLPEVLEDCAGATKRGCAMKFQETILQRLGKALHVRMDDIRCRAGGLI
jgi:hypothetical protein